jgi:hypothetical protein
MEAAIVYLTQKKDVFLLIESIKLLSKNFLFDYPYPVLILEDDLTESDKENIKKSIENENIKSLLQFVKINFLIPKSLDLNENLYNPPLSDFKMGYRNMCRFFSGEIFNFNVLQNYDFIWRLDSDSFILDKIDYDIFKFMEKNKKVYAYISEYSYDQPFVVEGLFELTKKFIESTNTNVNPVLQKSLSYNWNNEIFYTNFEIMDTRFFKNSGYMNYYKFIDETNNIFYKRWGDAPIRWLGVNIFANENDIFCVKDIAYKHQHWIKNI